MSQRPSLERQLEEHLPGGWVYEPRVPLELINEQGSVASRDVRGRPPASDVVERYRLAMEAGDEFPAILLTGDQRPGGLYVIDGLMIYLAARALGAPTPTVDAYVVPLDALAGVIDDFHFGPEVEGGVGG